MFVNPKKIYNFISQFPVLSYGATDISDENRQKLFESLDTLNKFLAGRKYITGSAEPTVADTTLFTTVANISVRSS